ncbi:transcription initiation factor TFIID subunit 8 [Hydra vulgaris]|uniref:Transcription initiation factor TFIID subunit 8 n=1 Tax=Hydra vulgaris TaxID=6087 RepID=A0ABM4CK91_HYDVU
MSSNDSNRKLLYLSAAAICKESGFEGASDVCLETLTELLQAYLTELTRTCRCFSELSHRTTPDFTDVKMALAEVGGTLNDIHMFSKHTHNQTFKIAPTKPVIENKTLKCGLPKITPPSYIPTYFPEYPEVYSFVHTPTIRKPPSQYQVVRERMASQRQMTEASLIKYIDRTNPSDTQIFENVDTKLYPISTVSIEPWPYLNALLLSNIVSDGLEPMQTTDEIKVSSNNLTNADNPYIMLPKKQRIKY